MNPTPYETGEYKIGDKVEVGGIVFAKIGDYPFPTDAHDLIAAIPCCGDRTNRDGGAHPWKFAGEDNAGIHYRCPECGAEDSD